MGLARSSVQVNAIQLLKTVAEEAREFGKLVLEDPAKARRELEFRFALFVDPPSLVAGSCPNGCCGGVHIHKEVEEEFLLMVEHTAAEIRKQEFGDEERNGSLRSVA